MLCLQQTAECKPRYVVEWAGDFDQSVTALFCMGGQRPATPIVIPQSIIALPDLQHGDPFFLRLLLQGLELIQQV